MANISKKIKGGSMKKISLMLCLLSNVAVADHAYRFTNNLNQPIKLTVTYLDGMITRGLGPLNDTQNMAPNSSLVGQVTTPQYGTVKSFGWNTGLSEAVVTDANGNELCRATKASHISGGALPIGPARGSMDFLINPAANGKCDFKIYPGEGQTGGKTRTCGVYDKNNQKLAQYTVFVSDGQGLCTCNESGNPFNGTGLCDHSQNEAIASFDAGLLTALSAIGKAALAASRNLVRVI